VIGCAPPTVVGSASAATGIILDDLRARAEPWRAWRAESARSLGGRDGHIPCAATLWARGALTCGPRSLSRLAHVAHATVTHGRMWTCGRYQSGTIIFICCGTLQDCTTTFCESRCTNIVGSHCLTP
jgi:hypothetical protein